MPKEEKKNIEFSPEQIEMVNKMIENAVSRTQAGDSSSVSVYGGRDKFAIESVNVRRYDAKFVVGFKNIQNDPMKKNAQYIRYGFDPMRKLDDQPYITLLLSTGEGEPEEREVRLIDYYNNSDKYQAKVVEIKRNKIIESHGILGSSPMATAVDDRGNAVPRSTIKQETMREEMTFMVELPGFDNPLEFKSDFLG